MHIDIDRDIECRNSYQKLITSSVSIVYPHHLVSRYQKLHV